MTLIISRGSVLLSRLLQTHIDLFIGAAFLSGGYVAPQPTFDYNAQTAMLKQVLGYDVFGYWEFFAADDAAALIEKNVGMIVLIPVEVR